MGVSVSHIGSKDLKMAYSNARFVTKKVTFDSSYPTGGEAITAADFGLTTLHAVVPLGPAIKSDATDSIPVAWNPETGKLVAYRQGAISAPAFTGSTPTFTGTAFAGGAWTMKHAAGAAAAGVAVYVHIDEKTEQGSNIAHLEFISPTTTDGTATIANGGTTIYLDHDAAANTGGFLLYIDEDATAGSRLLAAMGRDCYVPVANGDFIKITHNATPATPGVQVYFDEDAANTYERFLFVSPTTTDGADTTSATVSMRKTTPAGSISTVTGTVAAVSATPLAEVSNAVSLASYSVYCMAAGQ